MAFAAGFQLGSLFDAGADEAHDLVVLLLRHLSQARQPASSAASSATLVTFSTLLPKVLQVQIMFRSADGCLSHAIKAIV